MPGRKIRAAAIAASLALTMFAIAACGGDDSTPTATSPASSTSTATTGPTPSASAEPTETEATSTPTAGPTATPTATSTPTPTPTPAAPDAVVFAIFDLSDQLGVSAGELSIAGFEEAVWSSTALGCPEPGSLYTQMVVPGWDLQIRHGDTLIEYHTNADGSAVANCTRNAELTEDAVNIADELDLRGSTEVEIKQVNQAGGYDTRAVVDGQADIEALINALDVPVVLSPSGSCRAVYQLVFDTPSGEQSIFAICSGFTRMARGGQGFWDGMEASVPIEFSRALGPLVSDYSVPTLPTAVP